jgi:hypothetical protein
MIGASFPRPHADHWPIAFEIGHVVHWLGDFPSQDESLQLEWALTLGWKTALIERSIRALCSGSLLTIFFAVDGLRYGHHLWNFFQFTASAVSATSHLRPAFDPLNLVLYSFDRLATASAIRATDHVDGGHTRGLGAEKRPET